MSFAATHWVSSTGVASWENCQSETDPGLNYCSRSTANSSAQAGDIVYFKGGTYSVDVGGGAIAPSNSGTDVSSKIVFSNAPGEIPIITNSNSNGYVFYLVGNSYIKIEGFIFRDCPYWGSFINSSHHNEITNCTFDASTYNGKKGRGIFFDPNSGGCTTYNCWNTHNWIHGNVFSGRVYPSDECAEGVDHIRIGTAYGDGNTEENDSYNTVEDNIFEHTGHTIIDNYGVYNVINNNIIHNEPWITGCTSGPSGKEYTFDTSPSSVSIGTGDKTFMVSTGKTYGIAASAISESDKTKVMNGYVKSYNSVTGELVITVLYSSGSGTASDWIISHGNYPYYENAAYNGKFGHRNIQLTDDYGRDGTYVLLEGNRIGHASMNPGNDGGSNIDLASPRNIIRYNDLYNAMASGIYFKYTRINPCSSRDSSGDCGGINNKIYNNTIYHNGHGVNWQLYGSMNMGYSGQGIAQTFSNELNTIKNNIIHDNGYGDICEDGRLSLPCSTQSGWDIISNNLSDDPSFVNPDISDATSTTLPNLSLQSSSNAIDGGTYLTIANGLGSSSTTLIVDDAMYFQDGTWGSDLARGVTLFPDWIAIGTVNNVVQISSINYSTNTITLASPMIWADDAPIWLYKKSDGVQVLHGQAPDYGAHEWYAVYHQRQSSGAMSGGSIPAP